MRSIVVKTVPHIELYYRVDDVSFFSSELTKAQGEGTAFTTFAPTVLYSDSSCSQIVKSSSLIFESTFNFMNNQLQPYIDGTTIFLETGYVIASTRLDTATFEEENVPYRYRVNQSSGVFKCAKIIQFINIGQGIRQVKVVK